MRNIVKYRSFQYLQSLISLRALSVLRDHQVAVGNPCLQLAGFLQDVLQKVKAFFLEYGVTLPGVLGLSLIHI